MQSLKYAARKSTYHLLWWHLDVMGKSDISVVFCSFVVYLSANYWQHRHKRCTTAARGTNDYCQFPQLLQWDT